MVCAQKLDQITRGQGPEHATRPGWCFLANRPNAWETIRNPLKDNRLRREIGKIGRKNLNPYDARSYGHLEPFRASRKGRIRAAAEKSKPLSDNDLRREIRFVSPPPMAGKQIGTAAERQVRRQPIPAA